MSLKSYPALFDPHDDGRFDVTFPDIPGCITQGDDLADAYACAIEALALHLSDPAAGDPAPPEPSRAEDIQADPENADCTVQMVPVLGGQAARKKVAQITVDPNVLDAIDAVTKNRSAYFEEAAREKLGIG